MMKKKALGRGLKSLLSDTPETESFEEAPAPVSNMTELPIGEIEVNPFQPRQHFDAEALRELSESIKVHGIIQPITVRKLARNEEEMRKFIHTIDLDIVGADSERTGLKGSPTIVAATEKVGEIGGSCKMHEGQSVETLVDQVIKESQLGQFLVA